MLLGRTGRDAAAVRPPVNQLIRPPTHLNKEGVRQPQVIQDFACRGWASQARGHLFDNRHTGASLHTGSTVFNNAIDVVSISVHFGKTSKRVGYNWLNVRVRFKVPE